MAETASASQASVLLTSSQPYPAWLLSHGPHPTLRARHGCLYSQTTRLISVLLHMHASPTLIPATILGSSFPWSQMASPFLGQAKFNLSLILFVCVCVCVCARAHFFKFMQRAQQRDEWTQTTLVGVGKASQKGDMWAGYRRKKAAKWRRGKGVYRIPRARAGLQR